MSGETGGPDTVGLSSGPSADVALGWPEDSGFFLPFSFSAAVGRPGEVSAKHSSPHNIHMYTELVFERDAVVLTPSPSLWLLLVLWWWGWGWGCDVIVVICCTLDLPSRSRGSRKSRACGSAAVPSRVARSLTCSRSRGKRCSALAPSPTTSMTTACCTCAPSSRAYQVLVTNMRRNSLERVSTHHCIFLFLSCRI